MPKKLSKIEIVREILEKRQNRRVSWEINGIKGSSILDYFSAKAVNLVYESFDDERREKLMACEWPKLIRIAFKYVSY